MEKEKILKILEDYEYFVDDDWGGHYEHINCKQRAFTPLGILEILDYIDNLETQLKKQKEINQKSIEYIKEKQKIQYKFALSHIECDDLLQILEDKEETVINVGEV